MFASAYNLKPNDWILKRKDTIKPWTEFFNCGKFRKPITALQVKTRLQKNIEHFQSNYLIVFIILAIYCM